MLINLHSIAYPVTALGPGMRAALWVAGCSRRCAGCISPLHQDPSSGRMMSTLAIVLRLARQADQLEGITISGGEPFEQPEALHDLIEMIRVRIPSWSIIVYTGFTLAELKRMQDPVIDALTMIDVLIDGPYMERLPSPHALKGSSNQRIYCFTEQGRALKRLMRAIKPGELNFGLGPAGMQMFIGVPKTTKARGI